MSDLEADPLVMFQHKHYLPLALLASIFIPMTIQWLCWGESLKVLFFSTVVHRYVLSLHITWLINSAAHMYGMKPFDKYDKDSHQVFEVCRFYTYFCYRGISPSESPIVSFLAFGEGDIILIFSTST